MSQTQIITDIQNLIPSKPDFKEFMLNERRKAEQGCLNKLAVLELFAGIGAPHSALDRSHPGKFSVLDVVEIWKKAVQAYNSLYATNYDPQDVRTWFWEFDIRFDLVFHGSPCQDFSNAGKRKGGEKGSGTRSATLWETDDIIRNRLKKKPKVVIWENVKGALSGQNRSVFDAYVSDLAGMGYTTKWEVLNSKDFGVPQNRNRVFALSILNEFAHEFADFSFDNLVRRPYKPAKLYLETEVDAKYFISASAPSMMKAVANGKIKMIGDVCQTVTTKQDRWNSAGVVPVTIEVKDYSNFITMPDSKGELINGSYNRAWKLEGSNNTIGAMTAAVPSKILVPISGYYTQDLIYDPDGGLMPTLGTGIALNPRIFVRIGSDGSYSIDKPIPGKALFNYKGQLCHVRRITERESFRYMDFFDHQFDKVANLSSGDLYKLSGNSIVVSVLAELFDKLFYGWKESRVA